MPERPVREFIDEYRAGKRLIARRRAAFAAMLALQYLALACDSAALYAAFLALHVAPGAWSVVMGFVIAMSGMAFVGAPGGGGTFEALMTGFFASQGMPTAQALAATVLYRIVAFWAPAVVGVAVIAWLRRRPAPRHARARP
jgi:uncharacterized protein (TIRG00374 family)